MLRSFAAPLLAAAAAGAQPSLPGSLSPNAAELGRDSTAPLMGPGCRLQQLYELSEVPGAVGSTVRVRAIALRFDGPTGGAPPAAHRIDELTLRLGATHRSVDQVGSVFDHNLTLPLRTVLRVAGYRFVTDGLATAGPEPWGGPSGQLRFALPEPVAVDVPSGGSLVLEIVARGNSNGADPARLDFWVETAAVPQPGRSFSSGIGCWNEHGLLTTLTTLGQHEPGTAFVTSGAGYTPGGAVFTLLTWQLLSPILLIRGTPGCWLYVDPHTGAIANATIADPTGATGGTVPLPRSPVLSGAKLYVQNVGLAPVSATNSAGVVSSNYRTIDVGTTAPPIVRGWHVADPANPDAPVGSLSVAGGLAVRIE